MAWLYVDAALTFGGRSLRVADVILDTGSAGTIFSADRLFEIGIAPEGTDPLRRIRGIGGTELVFMKRLERLAVGELEAPDFEIEVGHRADSVARYGLRPSRPGDGYRSESCDDEEHGADEGRVGPARSRRLKEKSASGISAVGRPTSAGAPPKPRHHVTPSQGARSRVLGVYLGVWPACRFTSPTTSTKW